MTIWSGICGRAASGSRSSSIGSIATPQVWWYSRGRLGHGTWRDHLVWDSKALIQKRTRAGDPAGKEAISRYRVIEALEGASLIEVRLVTGKRNQIRLQARLRGHTLVGEQRYVYGPDALRSIEFSRQALHAHRLSFQHPVDGRPLTFEAPLPADLTALVERLRTPVTPAARSRRAAPSAPVPR
jgi:hypothetical protein